MVSAQAGALWDIEGHGSATWPSMGLSHLHPHKWINQGCPAEESTVWVSSPKGTLGCRAPAG